ncbi:HAD-IIB family hydrolase [Candidatus Wolfebacteria bacterium]|nr:HAD-IIB family hydrolase [Candidatus Wolfebacteria bacterium]
MLNKDIPRETLDRLKLVVFDSDGVSVPRGTEIREHVSSEHIDLTIRAFMVNRKLVELLARLRKRVMIVIASGRSLLHLETMYGTLLGDGTILQAENGNLSLIGGRIVQHFAYSETYFGMLAAIRRDARTLPIKGIEPKQLIVSVHAERELPEMYDIVERHDERHELKTMWNGEAFDIQRRDVSKAAGLQKLMKHIGVTPEETLAIGDRVNDVELLASVGVAISADKSTAPAEFWTEGEGLPGEILAQYLVETYEL